MPNTLELLTGLLPQVKQDQEAIHELQECVSRLSAGNELLAEEHDRLLAEREELADRVATLRSLQRVKSGRITQLEEEARRLLREVTRVEADRDEHAKVRRHAEAEQLRIRRHARTAIQKAEEYANARVEEANRRAASAEEEFSVLTQKGVQKSRKLRKARRTINAAEVRIAQLEAELAAERYAREAYQARAEELGGV